MRGVVAPSGSARYAANRRRQREAYGCEVGDAVRQLTDLLRITQARLADVVGLTPVTLNQWVSGRSVHVLSPVAVRRMLMLVDEGPAAAAAGRAAVDDLLDRAAQLPGVDLTVHPIRRAGPCRGAGPARATPVSSGRRRAG